MINIREAHPASRRHPPFLALSFQPPPPAVAMNATTASFNEDFKRVNHHVEMLDAHLRSLATGTVKVVAGLYEIATTMAIVVQDTFCTMKTVASGIVEFVRLAAAVVSIAVNAFSQIVDYAANYFAWMMIGE